MQALLSRAVLAAALLSTGAAHAAIDTHAFTLDGVPFDPFAGITLLSDGAAGASFALDGLARGLHSSADSTGVAWAGADTPWQNFYNVTVKDGYRVTGMSVTGTFHGTLAPAAAGGVVDNDIAMAFLAWAPGNDPVWSTSARATGLQGQQSWTVETGATALDGSFLLSFLASASSYAGSGAVAGGWLGSTAAIGASDLVLTVDVSPVPEPQAWLMLLVGLMLAAGTGGRMSAVRNATQRQARFRSLRRVMDAAASKAVLH